ncbi:hypothetical protein ACETU7_30100 [Rhodococcus sp. 3Y1]
MSKSIRELIDTQRLRRMDVETERYVAEQGRDSGLSIDGTARVLDALEQGKVETLLLTDPDDKEVTSGELIGPADRVLPLHRNRDRHRVGTDRRTPRSRRRIRRDTSTPLNAGAC